MLNHFISDMILTPDFGCSVYADYLEDQGKNNHRWRSWAERIDSLDEEQASLLSVWKDYWVRAGRIVGLPLDKEELLGLFQGVYAVAGLTPPEMVVTLRSPLEGVLGAYLLNQVRDHVGNQVRDQVWNQVRDQVWDQMYTCSYGNQDAHWLAFYSYFLSVGRLKFC